MRELKMLEAAITGNKNGKIIQEQIHKERIESRDAKNPLDPEVISHAPLESFKKKKKKKGEATLG